MKKNLWLPGAVAIALSALLFFLLALSEKEIIVQNNIPVVVSKPVTILAFGDMMLDRAVRQKIDQYGAGYPFEKIKTLFPGHDIIVANAEGVFSHNESISVRDHEQLIFTFATTSLPTLKALGFTIFSQANNHALNFGWSGLRESQGLIRAAGIDAFGDPDNVAPGPVYENIRGELIAFVGYSQFAIDGGSSSTTVAAIKQAKLNNAFVIVYPHWGDEYNLGTTSLQVVLGHKFVDAGADVVLGGHPHVVEPMEIYKGKAIFYSMGNFIFDQHWNEDVKHGLAVEITLAEDKVSYRTIPYVINNAQPEQTGEIKSFVLNR